jgi:hypothetical protein
MALDLFRLDLGIGIEDLTSEAHILQGVGGPGGDAATEDAAPVGSIYMRTDAETDNLQFYYKWTTVNNSSADWRQAASKEYVDAIAAGLSWREPALVLDSTTYANIAAAETAANVGDTVNGITIAPDDRVLFTDLTTGNENVYIVSGSTGAWTFTEDTNTATDGDAVLMKDGTHAEEQWVYDGINWVQFGAATSGAELGFIRAYIGKTGPGSEFPTYSSTDVITQSSNLETAIGDLDNAMGDGEIINDGGNFALTDDMSWGAAGTLEITDALNNLNDAIGDRTYTNDNVVTDGESVGDSINALDTAIGDVVNQTLISTGTNVIAVAGVTTDTLALTDATEVRWIVQVRETATPANIRAIEIHALNDGSSLIDYNRYSRLRLGSNIAGLQVQAVIVGTDMILRVTATNNIDYVVKRLGFTAF